MWQNMAEAAEAIGIGLQAFCIPGSVAEDRKVGLGHGNLGAMLLRPSTAVTWWLKVPLQRSVDSDAALPGMWGTHSGKRHRTRISHTQVGG